MRDHRGHFKKAPIPAAVRREVVSRYGAKPNATVSVACEYCERRGSVAWYINSPGRKNSLGWPTISGLELEHVEPEFRGGATEASNIVLACLPCNRSKGPRTLAEWRACQ
jgi:5-methylcytosine-specific restriction endonuclease McrA